MISYIKSIYKKIKRKQVVGSHTKPMDTHPESQALVSCLNCGTQFYGSYCPHCGQSSRVGRLKIRQGLCDLLGIFTNFDSGFLHTCLELIYRPGYMMRDYIAGHRKEYVKPIQLLFLLTTIYIAVHFVLFGKSYGANLNLDFGNDENANFLSYIRTAIIWMKDNQALCYLIVVTMLVLPNKLFFSFTKRGRKMNISEHFFSMVYVGCQMIILQILEMPIIRLFTNYDESGVGAVLIILVWDFMQLFNVRFGKSLLLTILSIICAVIIVAILAALLISLLVTFGILIR